MPLKISQSLKRISLQRQLWRSQQQELIVSKIALRVRQYLSLDKVLESIVTEVKTFLEADRVIIYQFEPDFKGVIVAEAVSPPWTSCLNLQIVDTCFQANQGGVYREGQIFMARDVYEAHLTPCHLGLLARFEVKANLVVPILLEEELLEKKTDRPLWGLLIAHQCSRPRDWEINDIKLLQNLTVQLAIALQQSELYKALEDSNHSLEKKVTVRTLELQENQQILRKAELFNRLAVEASGLGIWELDFKTNNSYISPKMAELMDYSPQERIISSHQWLNSIISEDRDLVMEALATCKETGSFFNLEFRITLKNGQQRWLYSRGSLIYDQAGEPQSISGCSLDISDRKVLEQEKQQAQQQLENLNQALEAKIEERTLALAQINSFQQAILNSTTYAIIATDVNGIIQTFNKGAEVLTGYKASEMIGKYTPELIHDPIEVIHRCQELSRELNQDIPLGFEVFVAKARLNLVAENEWRYIRKDGSRVSVLLSVTALRNEQQEIIGFLGIAKDLTETQKIEQERAKLAQRLEVALQAAAIGFWDWDLQSTEIIWDDRLFQLYGRTPTSSGKIQYPEWREWVDPESMDRAESQLSAALLQGDPLEIELCIYYPDRSVHYLQMYAIVIRDQANVPTRIIGVNYDITAIKEAEVQLRRTNEELIRATRLKDEFLANMSHELRTPLNSILGMTEALAEGLLGEINEKQQESLGTVANSANHLLSLINDILDVAKIESGQVVLECQPVAVAPLCQASLAFVKQLAVSKRIQLKLNLCLSLPPLMVDERRIRQVLINLLNNAVKFTPEGGNVTLEVSQLPDQGDCSYLRLAVIDTGIGITPENAQKLFKPFFQIDSALNRKYQGTGLGLALVKNIVELHGGIVSLISEPGKGSSFMIDLPAATIAPTTLPTHPLGSTLLCTNADYLLEEDIACSPLILLVEDNQANIATVSNYLTAKGYRLLFAYNGEEALTILQSQSPDLILMDIQMPKMDGLEATQYIRNQLQLTDIPIIAFTALAMPGDRERCLAAGANEYLSKPVKLKVLVETMQRLLNPSLEIE